MRDVPQTRAAWWLAALVLLILSLVSGGRGLAAPGRAMFSANVRVNHATTDQQQEPSLAVNPINPQRLIAAAKDWRGGEKEVWHYRSTDGGSTWADSHLPGLPTDLPNQSDPVVLYGADGMAYTSLIAYNQEDLSKGGLFVARSTDDGATWSPPVQAAANSARIFHDKEWLTIDRSPTATRGTLYLTWTRFTTINPREEHGDIVAAHSTDGGATWSAPVQVSRAATQDDVQGSFPAVGPAGDLHVLYYDQTRGQQLWVGRSTDGGQTFAPPVKAADVQRPPSPLPTSRFRTFILPFLAINPVDGALVAVWNDYTGNSDVRLVTSRDGGAIWSAPVRVNRDAGEADQFFPAAAFGPDGRLHLAWLDRRDDPGNLTFSCYYTQSNDDGQTFSQEVRLSDAQSDPSIGFGGTLIGDYIQVDAVADHAWVAWVDTRAGDQDIYSTSITGALDAGPLPTLPALPTETGTPPLASPTPPPRPSTNFADPAFARVWERADRPVTEGLVARPWMWGPAPFAAGSESYLQGVNGRRLVQYFDKSRMEINKPSADPTQHWYVTNGLLVVEMMTGQIQEGDAEFATGEYQPNPVPVAGDPDSPDTPTYATLAAVASLHGDNRNPDRTGAPVTESLDRASQVAPGAPALPPAASVHYTQYDGALGHNIPNVFRDFIAQQGPVYEAGTLTQGPVVDPLFDLGHPITEAYWVRLRIAGQDRTALIQAYQRRVLTYVPDNPAPWRVEMSNVGRHYYDWRYGPHSPYAEERGDLDEDD